MFSNIEKAVLLNHISEKQYNQIVSEIKKSKILCNNEKSRRSYINNKNKILEKIDCPCGGSYRNVDKRKHCATKKHRLYERQQENETIFIDIDDKIGCALFKEIKTNILKDIEKELDNLEPIKSC